MPKWLSVMGKVALTAGKVAAGLPLGGAIGRAVAIGNAVGAAVTGDAGTASATAVLTPPAPIAAIMSTVSQVEIMAQAMTSPISGPEKLKAATALAAPLLLAWIQHQGHDVADDALFIAGVEHTVSGVVDIMNSWAVAPEHLALVTPPTP